MHYTALKELPQGQQPGDVIDVHEDVGNVLILVGAARESTADEIAAVTPKAAPARGRYRRRDLRAEE